MFYLLEDSPYLGTLYDIPLDTLYTWLLEEQIMKEDLTSNPSEVNVVMTMIDAISSQVVYMIDRGKVEKEILTEYTIG